MPLASVIVPTFNGAHKLPLLLDGLEKQTIRDFELVIVIDGSTDHTRELLTEFKHKFNSLRILEQQNAGRSTVRNNGAKESTGEVLIFYDDDMVPGPESVGRHLQLHGDGADKLVSGNQVEYKETGKSDVQNYKATRTVHWTDKYVTPITKMDRGNLFFTAANCSIRKSLFNRLHGFDERLTDAEDYNLAMRALDVGAEVVFDKLNIAIHRDAITAHSYVIRLRQYAKAHEQLHRLFPEHPVTQEISTSLPKRLVYRFFARKIFVRWMDEQKFMFLPNRMRYQLYDIILHALTVEYPRVSI